MQALVQAVSATHGRALIYVWAIEQDALSKRVIPSQGLPRGDAGQDVFVPWILTTQKTKRRQATILEGQNIVEATKDDKNAGEQNKVFNRYYHMFSKGELYELTTTAAQDLGLVVGNESDSAASQGVEVMQCGWERSNYYIEIRRWRR